MWGMSIPVTFARVGLDSGIDKFSIMTLSGISKYPEIKFSFPHFIPVLLLFQSIFLNVFSPVIAGELSGTNRIPTVIFDFGRQNLPDAAGEQISQSVISRLETIDNLKRVSQREIGLKTASKCHLRECGLGYGKLLGAQRAIIGTIKHVETRELQTPMSDNGILKYLVQVDKIDYYSMEFALLDIPSGRELTRFSSPPFEMSALEPHTAKIKAGFEEYFQPIPEPKSISPNIFRFSPESFSPSASSVIPHNRLAELFDYGYGLSLNLDFQNQLFKSWKLRFAGGIYSMKPSNLKINNITSLPVSFQSGPAFSPVNNLSITPLAGFGYQIYFIKNYDKSSNVFFDPMIMIEADLGYSLFKDYTLFLMPGYTMLFEKRGEGGINLGGFFNINLGIKKIL
jgi:hypothetical protein